ncbi:MAG: toll/interleukin-1 receptor domain-containing protein [Candidatus Thiodiazotropha sp.]
MTTKETNGEPVFFVSRAGADSDVAIVIAGILREAGCHTWLQDEDFGHASFMARMAQGFAGGNRMIALLSHAYQQSEYCKKEYEQLLAGDPRNLKERLIVLRIEEVAPIEILKDLAYTDLVPVLNDASNLARVVRVAVGVEKRQAECDFAALYQRSPQPIVHPEIEAIRSFIGRDTELVAINSALRNPNDTQASTVALTDTGTTAVTGMGGVGKTLLAKQYAWLHSEGFKGLWWARGERRQTLIDDLVTLGARLIPGLAENPDLEAAARATLDQLAYDGAQDYPGAKPWLLIYDNVESPELIQGLVPQQGVCLLITSRWSDWHDYAQELTVDTFPPETAVQFLLARSHNQDIDGATHLAEALGYLPLALDQARSYCWRTHLSFEQYRARLPELIKKMPRQARYPEPVFATFDLALAQASMSEPASEHLMLALSFLAPDAIPMSLATALMPEDDMREDAISTLADLSLLNYGVLDDGTPSINLHRLVQEVARERLDEKHQEVISQNLDAVLKFWPGGNDGGDPKYWPICRQLLLHALTLLDWFESTEVDLEKIALLQSYVGYYLNAVTRYEESEQLDRQALGIRQRVLGEEHPSTATSYNNLACNLHAQGRYKEAEPLYRQALEIRQRVLGEEHPSTAASYNNVAFNLDAQGHSKEAEPLYRQALEIRQRVLGEEHPSTADSYNNVASNLDDQGRSKEAEALYRQALEIRQRVRGKEHPDTAASYNNVAFNLHAQGRYKEAELLYRHALEIHQRLLGEEHLSTATSYNNVASNLDAQERYEEAEPLHCLALKIRQRVLGEEHSDTATIYNNLAYNHNAQGRYEEAETLYRQALEIHQWVLGEEHPSTATSYNNVASNLDAQERYEEAEPLYRQALKIRQRVLGEEHNDTAASYNNVASNLNAQGRYEEAEPLYRRALEIMRASLPPTHPSIETVQGNLNDLLAKMER